jgi:hypothetical protein
MTFADPPPAVAGESHGASATPSGGDQTLLLAACRQVLVPLARLAVERGVPYAQVDELLRSAFVEAARAVHPTVAAQRGASRISAATGLTRREVTRLLQPEAPVERSRRSPATQVFSRWLTDPQLRPDGGAPRALPRQGPAPSFESLAHSVTKDVHPRTLLEELLRLGLVRVDEASDTVHLLRETFVPSGDQARMFGFLGANVGDHLSAAVANVLSHGPRNLEQALFAPELSKESIERLRPVVADQWQALARHLVPLVQQLIDEDDAAGRKPDQRLRVGLYMFANGIRAPAAPADPVKDTPPSSS